MDEIAKYNIERWRALCEAGALYTRPLLGLDAAGARERVDPEGRLGELAGRRVLCLAGGGGRESAAFALLGARVTVFDLSEAQLGQDALAAAHYGVEVETIRGDMRDLSALAEASFDVVSHSYSLNFVPDPAPVFRGVARVIRPGGLYRFMCANPFVMGAVPRDWNGAGYTLRHTYTAGAELAGEDESWVYEGGRTEGSGVPRPREFRHTLAALVDGLAAAGFVILHASEDVSMFPDEGAEPGTWEHFVSVVRPWLTFLCAHRPEAFGAAAPRRQE